VTKVLLDSDILIEWLRGHEPVVQRIQALIEGHAQLFWTPVSVAEIFAGVRKGEDDDVANLFVLLEPISITPEIGRKAGHFLNSFAKSHAVELGNALIAACASTAGMSLWTRNRKRYPMKELDFYS
jgi:hypothetical protein